MCVLSVLYVACVWYVWHLCSVCGKFMFGVCGTTVNKNPETDIGLQPEDQKSKAASHWLLPLPQSKMAILPPGISE